MAHRSSLLVLGATLLAFAAFACNGQVNPTDETSGSTTSESKAGKKKKADQEAPVTSSTSGSPGTAPVCQYANSGSSSGGSSSGSFSCESASDYDCPTGQETIKVSCTSQNGAWAPGTLSCNGVVFAFDCAQGCSPGPAEYAKCGLPAPPESSGEGGSSTSSSSSSSGG